VNTTTVGRHDVSRRRRRIRLRWERYAPWFWRWVSCSRARPRIRANHGVSVHQYPILGIFQIATAPTSRRRCDIAMLTRRQPWHMLFVGHHIYQSHTVVAVLEGVPIGVGTSIPFRSGASYEVRGRLSRGPLFTRYTPAPMSTPPAICAFVTGSPRIRCASSTVNNGTRNR